MKPDDILESLRDEGTPFLCLSEHTIQLALTDAYNTGYGEGYAAGKNSLPYREDKE